MIRVAGWLIVLYGAAHTLGALAVEGAAVHTGAWFSGRLWTEGLASMSPAMSAYWLSVNSFGPMLILIGLIVLWLNRRGITAPPFIAVTLAIWILVGVIVIGPGMDRTWYFWSRVACWWPVPVGPRSETIPSRCRAAGSG